MILANYGIVSSSGGSVPLLLDTYSGATGAYSLRKIKLTYTGYAIRVRRSSDNTSQDIGFNGLGDLDTTTLISFVGANDGFVSIWYDQSGASKNMVQNTSAIQPQIVSSGSVLLDGGKPVIYFNSQRLSVTSPALDINTKSLFYVGKSSGVSSNNGALVVMNSTPSDNPEIRIGKDVSTLSYWNGGYVLNGNYGMSTRKLYTSIIATGKTHTLYGNSSQLVTATRSGTFNTITEFTLGGYAQYNGFQVGYMNECVLYTTDQTSNKTGIESNINAYYSLY